MVEPGPDYIAGFFDQIESETGRRYARGDLTASGLSGGGYNYEYKGVRRVWRCPPETLERYDREGRLHWPKNGVPRLKRYLDTFEGVPVQDIWTDIKVIHNQSTERTGYSTQKPETLLGRILKASSNEGDLVADFSPAQAQPQPSLRNSGANGSVPISASPRSTPHESE